jgi:hypothetical protein
MDEGKLIEQELHGLAERLIENVTKEGLVREGVVMTQGKLPYRRLDCDGRALAYIRPRPKKKGVRIDVSGLWAPPSTNRLQVSSSTGCAALLVQCDHDVAEASGYLLETVTRTRALKRKNQSGEQA